MTGFLFGVVAATALYAWRPTWPGNIRAAALWLAAKVGLTHGAP